MESSFQRFSPIKMSVPFIAEKREIYVLSMYDTLVSNLGAILTLRRKRSDRLVAARSTRSAGTPYCVADACVLKYPAKRRMYVIWNWKEAMMKAVRG
jgi:hypothetical protein